MRWSEALFFDRRKIDIGADIKCVEEENMTIEGRLNGGLLRFTTHDFSSVLVAEVSNILV